MTSADSEPRDNPGDDELIEDALATDRLLPGEEGNLASTHPDDAQHWRDVYVQLVEFKQGLLEELEQQVGKVAPAGQPELQRDRAIMEREAGRLTRRLDYWQCRLDDLTGRAG